MRIENSPSSSKAKDTPLLRKLDVPVVHLDYEYVRNCTNVREIEKILRILRSGEEGRYEDLEAFVENRLRALQPASRHLHVEVPVLTRSSLERSEVESLDLDLLNWIQQIEKCDAKDAESDHGACTELSRDMPADHQVPVRGSQIVIPGNESCSTSKRDPISSEFIKQRHPEHIKSWEYDKWAKFNVDAELTKLEIEEMREEELSRTERGRAKGKVVEKRDSETESRAQGAEAEVKAPSSVYGVNVSTRSGNTELGPSYIEEILVNDNLLQRAADSKECLENIQESDEQKQGGKAKGRRRFKIVIDDINIS